jgi:DNA polymerase elongation subunit (family B)
LNWLKNDSLPNPKSKVKRNFPMQQRVIIPHTWQGLDYTPTWENEETGEKEWGTRKYRIFIWGHDDLNKEVCWVVDDYMPHLYVRIEQPVEDEEKLAPFILDALNQNLKAYIKEKSSEPRKGYLKGLLKLDNIILGYIPEDRYPLFYYKNKTHRVYKVFFQLEGTMQLCYEYLDNRKIVMPNGFKLAAKAYNNGDSDRIPTEEKLIVEKKLERCSWMYADGREVEHEGLTTLDREYIVSWQQLQKMPADYALKLGFPKPSTISFDSETFSAVFTRFPKASRLTDEMYAVGFRHRTYDSLHCKTPKVVNYMFVIWDHKKYGELKDYSKEYGETVYVYCLTEQELLMQLFEYIRKLDPTCIVGYNQLGFDWDYVEQRCEIFGIKPPNLSRIRGWFKTQFMRKSWKRFSSAWPQYPGRLDVDMLYLIRLQFKFNDYKLKNVAKALLPGGHTKVELPYKEQFRIYASKEIHGMNKIMDYLHMDIMLPEELYDKLAMPVYLHTNASVMRVNILQLYTEGQSTRCINQLYDQVVEDGMYVNSRTIWKAGKYIGGLVFDQIAGIYDNVLTFDFNSLYPSEMKANNICYSTLIDEEAEKEKPEEERIKDDECHVVEGEVPIIDKKTKAVISMDYHKFRYILKSKRVGLLPKIVTKLNKLRNEYKIPWKAATAKVKALKKEYDALKSKCNADNTNDETELQTRKAKLVELTELIKHWQTEEDIWNVKQTAVKVSANSMYGFMGMKTGKFSFIEGGMSTTLAGREALRKTLSIVIEKFGAKLVYGDSVTGQTPLLLRLSGALIDIMTIEDLFNTCGKFHADDSGKEYKTLSDKSLVEVWTETGWTKIENIMRHKTNKKIYGVMTKTGYVEVTEDHSLLNHLGMEVSANQVEVGDQLMQSYPNAKVSRDTNIDTLTIEVESQIAAARRFRRLKLEGYHVGLNVSVHGKFKLTASRNSIADANNIVKIEQITSEASQTTVYDLTTANHHFQAGIGDIIVHNTDSVMVNFPPEVLDATNYLEKTNIISKYISDQFPDDINIVFENFFLRFFTVTKKRYAGIKINPDKPAVFPTEKEIIDMRLLYVKGLISVRGNSCGIVYENFDPFLRKMLIKIPPQDLLNYLHEIALKVMRREYPLEDYTFHQRLGANYKKGSTEMAVFSDQLKQKGRAHKPGEELEFVYTKTQGDCLKGYKMQAPDLFVENGNVLDTMYYVTNKLAKPIEQLLTCVYDDSIVKPSEKKIIRPRKPTKVQKVTNHWHLELYIRKYIANIHWRWEAVQNEIKLMRMEADKRGLINYVIGEEAVKLGMKQKYGVEWVPEQDVERAFATELKEPIHRHAVWG